MAAPRRKKRVHQSKEAPFPVPIATVTHETASRNQWFYYTGCYHGDHVTVQHSGDIHFLYKMGFFGKGTLSRSCPDFNQKTRTVYVPNKGEAEGESTQLKVLTRRQYLQHKKWSSYSSQSDSEEDDTISSHSSSEDEAEIEEVSTPKELIDNQSRNSDIRYWDMPRNIQEQLHERKGNEREEEERNKIELSGQPEEEEADILRGTELAAIEKPKDSWDGVESDEEFWGTVSGTEPVSKTETVKDNWDNKVADTDFWSTETTGDDTKSADINDNPNVSNSNENSSSHTDIVTSKSIQASKYIQTEKEIENGHEIFGSGVTYAKENKNDKNRVIACDKINVCKRSIKVEDSNSILSNQVVEPSTLLDEESTSKCKAVELLQSQNLNVSDQSKDSAVIPNLESDITDKGRLVHPLCRTDDSDGDTFVLEDSDSDTEWRKGKKKRRLAWMPSVKKDPYVISEDLRLSLEEAFFLSFGLGCLVVLSKDKIPMTLSAMWQTFSMSQKRFLPKYIAYHHFRSKGWVPKSGLKFGADFILYRVGPPFFHGSYSVIVRTVYSDTLDDVPEFTDREFTWTSMSGFNRATEHVAKEVLICYVIVPKHLSGEDLLSPRCICQCEVQEQVLTRWVSSQERENKDNLDEEIP